jgi:hypothetical protein
MPASLNRGSNPGEASVMIKGLVMGDSTLAVRQCYSEVDTLDITQLRFKTPKPSCGTIQIRTNFRPSLN